MPAFLRLPRGPAPPCHLCTMHLLEMLSLGCCLAAGAVLLGPRQPPVAAAYESGHGYYEEEPGAGEPKVGCSGRAAPLRLGNPAGEVELGEETLRVGIYLRGEKKKCKKKINPELQGCWKEGESPDFSRNAEHLTGSSAAAPLPGVQPCLPQPSPALPT